MWSGITSLMRPPGKHAHSQPRPRIRTENCSVDAHRLQFHKAAVRTAFLFNIAKCGNAPVLENEDFIAGLINIRQQMGRDEQPDTSFFPDIFDQLNHALPGDGIEAVGGLVQNEQFWTVRKRLG